MGNFSLKIQLRYSDFDTQKFVNHSKICTFIETSYVYFISEKINPQWNVDFMPLVLRREITDFLIPIQSTSKPICVVNVSEVKGASFTLAINIIDEVTNQTYVVCQRVLVHIDLSAKRPSLLSTEVKEKLNLYKIIS